MTLNPPYVVRLLIGIAVAIAGIVILLNLPAAGDNTVWVASGVGLFLAGVGLVIP